jgi:polar amino acid transport system permease protein
MIILENLRFLLIGTYPTGALGGLALTLILSVFVGVGAMCVGLLIASLSLSASKTVRVIAQLVPTLIRSLPSLVFLFWMYFLLPSITGLQLSPLASAATALAIYQGSFIAEDLRSGINAVAYGQAEAGAATGLSDWQIFFLITLPQAVRATIPALVNRYINLFLYTSTASVVGVMEFTSTTTLLNNRVMIHPIQIFGFAAAVYFIFCFLLARIGSYLERRWDWAPKLKRTSTAV